MESGIEIGGGWHCGDAADHLPHTPGCPGSGYCGGASAHPVHKDYRICFGQPPSRSAASSGKVLHEPDCCCWEPGCEQLKLWVDLDQIRRILSGELPDETGGGWDGNPRVPNWFRWLENRAPDTLKTVSKEILEMLFLTGQQVRLPLAEDE